MFRLTSSYVCPVKSCPFCSVTRRIIAMVLGLSSVQKQTTCTVTKQRSETKPISRSPLGTKNTIHQLTTMLSTSKIVLLLCHNHLLTTSADDHLISLRKVYDQCCCVKQKAALSIPIHLPIGCLFIYIYGNLLP